MSPLDGGHLRQSAETELRAETGAGRAGWDTEQQRFSDTPAKKSPTEQNAAEQNADDKSRRVWC